MNARILGLEVSGDPPKTETLAGSYHRGATAVIRMPCICTERFTENIGPSFMWFFGACDNFPSPFTADFSSFTLIVFALKLSAANVGTQPIRVAGAAYDDFPFPGIPSSPRLAAV